jgi:hypothetical protein
MKMRRNFFPIIGSAGHLIAKLAENISSGESFLSAGTIPSFNATGFFET